MEQNKIETEWEKNFIKLVKGRIEKDPILSKKVKKKLKSGNRIKRRVEFQTKRVLQG